MPITVGAIRKQRADVKKTSVNLRIKTKFKQAIVNFRKKMSKDNLTKVFSLLDRAAKKHAIHPNKASRLKARLAKLADSKKK
jgi:ribosomal protein S20